VRSGELLEELELILYGCTCLRVTEFPVLRGLVGNGHYSPIALPSRYSYMPYPTSRLAATISG